jgi:hypothetical protein
MTAEDSWLTPGKLASLDGTETFRGLHGTWTVQEFWRFALGDLRMNNARGYLAEFIVAKALGVTNDRVEWADYDLEWEGATIEVKASAYLQSWEQRAPSKLGFSGLRAKKYTPRGGYAAEKTFNADVYVFCAHVAETHESYDPLDVSQWQFYVVPNARVAARVQDRMALSTVKKISLTTTPFTVGELRDAVRHAAAFNKSAASNSPQ